MRALKQETAKLHISIAVIAPAITVTPILSTGYREAGRDPSVYAAEMAQKGVPINKVESIALAACWIFNQGMAANGAGIFVQADRFVDLRGVWRRAGSVGWGRRCWICLGVGGGRRCLIGLIRRSRFCEGLKVVDIKLK
jgi:hypothetical protein